MMRILQVNNINQVANTYGTDLTRRGHSVTVYEPSLVGGFAPLPLKLAMMPWRALDMRRVIGKLNRNYFDIVHIHWASYGVLGLVSQIPFIVHCHGDDVRDRLKQPFFHQGLSLLLRRAAAVLCITPDLLPVVRVVRPDAIFSPGPINTEQFIPGEIKPQRMPNSWTIILFARLDPEKGAEIAVQGIAQFAKRHPNVRVQLLDWGVLKEKYKQQYGDRFEFLSLIPIDEVPHLLQTADVVVGQLTSGALGLSELQAMSCGKPLIAFFRYGDAYPTPPPLCQATSPEEVDKHLENLFQHPEVAVMRGQQGREWAVRYHDYRILAGQLETLYQSIVERKGIEAAALER